MAIPNKTIIMIKSVFMVQRYEIVVKLTN
jgi:hypothetical protein